MKNFPRYFLIAVLSTYFGYLISLFEASKMLSKHAFKIEEPLLIEGEQQKNYAILPIGSVMYLDKSWPEGHQTFHAYFHFKGDLASIPADPDVISPAWLRTVDPDELPKLLNEYPLSKEELIAVLKSRKITKDELVQILREWPEDSEQQTTAE